MFGTDYDVDELQKKMVKTKEQNAVLKQQMVSNLLNNGSNEVDQYGPISFANNIEVVTLDGSDGSDGSDDGGCNDSPDGLRKSREEIEEHANPLYSPKQERPVPESVDTNNRFPAPEPNSAPNLSQKSRGRSKDSSALVRYDAPPISPEFRDKLQDLIQDMSALVEENKKYLKEADVKNMADKMRKKATEKTAEDRKQARQNISSILKRNSKMDIMPLWKHKLKGNHDPAPASVLKGQRLFRVIAKSLILVAIKPLMTIDKRNEEFKLKEQTAMSKILHIYAAPMDEWLGKLIHQPLSTLSSDETLNFDHRDVNFLGKAATMRMRLVQVKVRLKAIVHGISEAEMPNEHLTNFLVSLVDDNNYFPNGFFWDSEVENMEFSKYGATRNMLQEHEQDSSAEATVHARENQRVFDVSRVKMLLRNFVLVRILINHLLLSPWYHKVGTVPNNRNAKRVVGNVRILASLAYELVCSLDERTLPGVKEPPSIPTPSSWMSNPGRVGPTSWVTRSDSGKQTVSVVAGEGAGSPRSDGKSAKNASTKELVKDSFFTQATLKIMNKLGLADSSSDIKLKSGSPEDRLLNPRLEAFGTLPALHYLLIPPTHLDLRALQDLQVPLGVWLDKLVRHVLQAKDKKHAEQTNDREGVASEGPSNRREFSNGAEADEQSPRLSNSASYEASHSTRTLSRAKDIAESYNTAEIRLKKEQDHKKEKQREGLQQRLQQKGH